MLEAAPRLIRPLIRSGMKKDTPPAMLDRTFCLYKGEKEWRAALGVTNDKLPLILLLDAQSRPVWKHSGPFRPAVFATLRQQLNAFQ